MTNPKPFYKYVYLWVKEYGNSGAPDQRAVENFKECESDEAIRSLQAELVAISKGKYDQETFDKLVGIKRRSRHQSYDEWAKYMLRWLASR